LLHVRSASPPRQHHGEVGRIELPVADLPRAARSPLREALQRAVSAAGFRFVLD
jgi:pyridinium-3,5-biscarboxylic acid mononucleotide sulfurtransferase